MKMGRSDAAFVENIRQRVLNSKEELDPTDFDYLFTDDVTFEEADRYWDILDKTSGQMPGDAHVEVGIPEA